MVDVAKSRTINETIHKSVFILSAGSDGTGEANVKKINISDLPGAPTKVKITRLEWSVQGLNCDLHFDRTAGGDIAILHEHGSIKDEIEDKGTGLTGDIHITTTDAIAGGGYTILLEIQAA